MITIGDCREVMAAMVAGSIDSIVTDPPYHLTTGKRGGSGPASLNLDSPAGRARIGTGFMGMAWDGGGIAFTAETWALALGVAKPGAHLLAFGGPRTFHRLACAIEDAGWEIRDCLSWLYGQGFPKSLNLSGGLGTALKPAWEPIILARKPLHGTVAENMARHGVGAINVDRCRIAGDPGSGVWGSSNAACQDGRTFNASPSGEDYRSEAHPLGRWPANVVLDEAAASIVDEDSGDLGESTGGRIGKKNASSVDVAPSGVYRAGDPGFGDRGGASRFFYCAKADRSEREAGLDRTNHHPTVKPVDLMQWLCRMVTPRAGTVLDPFCGSGSTGIAALREGLDFVGIELVPDYAAIARRRIEEDAPLFNRQL